MSQSCRDCGLRLESVGVSQLIGNLITVDTYVRWYPLVDDPDICLTELFRYTQDNSHVIPMLVGLKPPKFCTRLWQSQKIIAPGNWSPRSCRSFNKWMHACSAAFLHSKLHIMWPTGPDVRVVPWDFQSM